MKYFAYCRKSQDDEERQMLSIPAQRDEVDRMLAKHEGIELVRVFEESRTAKVPGRPVFNDMMQRIERGEAEGIIAWHPDRLARNSIDGGLLIYQLDRGVLKDLKFSTYTFENSSQGKFMLQIMFGYSKYYVDSLSENVKRGNRRKIEQGILPNRPPIGYRNDAETNTIVPDPQTFPTIRKIWELALGGYSVQDIRNMAEHQWGFRTPKRKRSGGKALVKGTIYAILSNRFYTGVIPWTGNIYPGKHQPMVTPEEFERMQGILGRPGRPAPQKHRFPYTGLIRCGTCGCAVTAERQVNRYGYTYEYYRCTKKRGAAFCAERYIERTELERQVLAFLRRCQIPADVHRWAVAETAKLATSRATEDAAQIDALKAVLWDSEANLRTLTDLRIRELIDDAEFVVRRDELKAQGAGIREQIATRETDPGFWLEPFHAALSFSKLAVFWFERGDSEQKRLILATVGSNLTLSNKILSIQAAEPFGEMPKTRDFRQLCTVVDDVRTFSRPGHHDFHNRMASLRRLLKLQRKKRRKKKRPSNDNEDRKRAA